MTGPDFDRARQYALRRLECELAPQLYYHSLAHTRDSVVPATERLATRAGVSGEAMLLLRTAAWYHDLGFVSQREDHEVAGIKIAAEVLPECGYSGTEVAAIAEIILATRLPQTPHTALEEILADADLDSLGREDFLTTSLLLRAELTAYGSPSTELEWYDRQLRFIQDHCYFTTTARALRDPQKQRNIDTLKARLRSITQA